MLKLFLSAILLFSSLPAAFAAKLDMVAVSFFRGSGDVTKANVKGCPAPESCYSYSHTGLGVNLFFDSLSGRKILSRGIWVGQDLGYGRVGGDSMPYGTTGLGYAWGLDFDTLRYFIGLGYGVSYSTLDSKDYALQSSTNDGCAFITGVESSPFRLSHLVNVGMMLTSKASPDLLPVYAKDQLVNRRYFEPSLSSTFGLVFRFN